MRAPHQCDPLARATHRLVGIYCQMGEVVHHFLPDIGQWRTFPSLAVTGHAIDGLDADALFLGGDQHLLEGVAA
ncbi:hypothetical protein D3C81_1785930 [compost metagenome]